MSWFKPVYKSTASQAEYKTNIIFPLNWKDLIGSDSKLYGVILKITGNHFLVKLQDFMCSYQCKEILHNTSALLLVSVVFKNIFTLVLAKYHLLKKQQTFLCISETKNLILIPGHSSKIIHLESYIVETFLSFTNSLRCVSFSKVFWQKPK